MFIVNTDGSIHVTRGDIGTFEVGIKEESETEEGVESTDYVFKSGDVVRLNVHERNHPDRVVLLKDVVVESDTTSVEISLTREDTKIGGFISKPVIYWYEVELNPETTPQTFVGYDLNGPKTFTLYPEGADELCVQQ